MKSVLKILAFVCIGCFLIGSLLMFRSGSGLWSASKENTRRHLQFMAGLFRMEAETNSQQKQKQQQAYNQDGSLQVEAVHETSTISIRDLRERQLRRKQHIADACRSLSASGRLLTKNATLFPTQFYYFVVDESRRFIYCEVPKVGCTNWKRLLLVLAGRVNMTEKIGVEDVHKKYLPRLSNYQMPEIKHRLDTYYKFVFVREPFERLLSAHRNKFAENHTNYFHQHFGRYIVRRYRMKPTNESLLLGNDVTFKEFVTYMLDPMTTKKPFDHHWRPMYELCHPCFVNYDVVGKFETMNEDADFILDQLGVKDIVSFPSGYRQLRTSELVASKFANISKADMDGLLKIYSKDLLLFDYPNPSFGIDRSSSSD